jgi:CheY-like chemotaxis protein
MNQLRVLVVDDHRDTMLTLGILLRSEGYEVHLADNGEQALAEAGQFRPHVVLLDLGMPGRSGFDVASELGRRHGAKRPVLVAITGRTTAADRQRAETSGFHHFFSKPYDPQALLLLLDSLSLQA